MGGWMQRCNFESNVILLPRQAGKQTTRPEKKKREPPIGLLSPLPVLVLSTSLFTLHTYRGGTTANQSHSHSSHSIRSLTCLRPFQPPKTTSLLFLNRRRRFLGARRNLILFQLFSHVSWSLAVFLPRTVILYFLFFPFSFHTSGFSARPVQLVLYIHIIINVPQKARARPPVDPRKTNRL